MLLWVAALLVASEWCFAGQGSVLSQDFPAVARFAVGLCARMVGGDRSGSHGGLTWGVLGGFGMGGTSLVLRMGWVWSSGGWTVLFF